MLGAMSDLAAPPGQDGGEAARFLSEIRTVWDFFASYETSEPLVVLEFDDGRRGAIGDLPDAAEDLLQCLASYYDLPHPGLLHAKATPYKMEATAFDLHLSYEGVDGPLVVRFGDGTLLTAQVEPRKPSAPLTRWSAGVASGIAQQRIEAVVSLAQIAELSTLLEEGDRQVAEAVLALLSSLATTPEPPKRVVYEAARWLGRKVDLFIDEAVKTAGKTAGVVAIGGAAYAMKEHAPHLAERIRELVELAS